MKTERKNAISEEQLGLIERFLTAYNKVDHHMRDVMQGIIGLLITHSLFLS